MCPAYIYSGGVELPSHPNVSHRNPRRFVTFSFNIRDESFIRRKQKYKELLLVILIDTARLVLKKLVFCVGKYAEYRFDQHCSDEWLTLETSAKHHIPQATNIPYQPLLIKPIFRDNLTRNKTIK